ncbi:hypothetical protein Lepto7376_2646 [[Leptolyngbya] sp. PCC 7376]|uniref:PTPA-CTERM sorting domain-containing protein n=1 Tax=[Leptolyngbya] sp. PCC 7376 TaxID=111781 RepID=UPI00029F3B5F|nr:PTPA-CTERM sorting domain-containing protein [[Leptolyngbya] sp. PCC 7376]AFY38917.1 hypothetical protein Lepto7376_2646 [[Leptolyngbya] sp. PCC 7376]
MLPVGVSKAFTEGGLTVDVSTIPTSRLGRDNRGLFVQKPGIFNDIPNQVDAAANPNEFIDFDFGSELVQSISVVFSRVGFNDDFSFSVDGNVILPDTDILGVGNNRVFSFDSSVPLGSVLRFRASNFNDDFTISKLTVYAVQQVPTPAAVLPVISGLFAAAGRRKDEESEEA